jgi:predicted nicotinamide N-methyase
MTIRKRVLALALMAGVVAVSSALAGKGTWFLLTSSATADRFQRRTR